MRAGSIYRNVDTNSCTDTDQYESNEIDTLDAMSSKRRPDCVCKNRCFHKSQSRRSLFLRLLSFLLIVVLSRGSCSVGQTSSVKYYTLGVRTCWPENPWRCETRLQDEPSASDTWGQKERRIRNHVANVPLSHRQDKTSRKPFIVTVQELDWLKKKNFVKISSPSIYLNY